MSTPFGAPGHLAARRVDHPASHLAAHRRNHRAGHGPAGPAPWSRPVWPPARPGPRSRALGRRMVSLPHRFAALSPVRAVPRTDLRTAPPPDPRAPTNGRPQPNGGGRTVVAVLAIAVVAVLVLGSLGQLIGSADRETGCPGSTPDPTSTRSSEPRPSNPEPSPTPRAEPPPEPSPTPSKEPSKKPKPKKKAKSKRQYPKGGPGAPTQAAGLRADPRACSEAMRPI